MKKLKNFLFSLFMIMVLMNCVVVKADSDDNMIKEREWQFSASNSASAIFESTDSSNFKVNMSSIGTSEWDVKIIIDKISLEAGETYIYEADITSDKRRVNTFVQIYDENGNQLYNNHLINLEANTTNEVKKIFRVTKDYENVTIAYGFGYNNYEMGITPQNTSNIISVENISLKNIKDYDYSNLEYTSIPKSTFSGYENYYYTRVSNVNLVNPESRADFGIDTICVNVTTQAVASSAGLYETYLNGVKTQPYILESGVWFHLDYRKLVYEYNIIHTVALDGEIAVLVIKNENVTKYREEKLAQITTYESDENTDGVKVIIKEAKQKLLNSITNDEIDEVVELYKNKITMLIQVQTEAIEKIEDLVPENSSTIVKDLLKTAKEDINNSTTNDEVEQIVNEFETELNLQIAKEKAITDLTSYIGKNDSDTIKALYEKSIKEIEDATKISDVNDIYKKAKQDIELEIEKEKAIQILTNYIGKNYSNAIKEIYNSAIDDINEVLTINDINSILEQTKKAIDAERKKEIVVDNPITLDNIVLYLFMLIISVISIMYLKKKMV